MYYHDLVAVLYCLLCHNIRHTWCYCACWIIVCLFGCVLYAFLGIPYITHNPHMCISCDSIWVCHETVLAHFLCLSSWKMYVIHICIWCNGYGVQCCAQTIRCSLGCACSSSLLGGERSVLRAKGFAPRLPSICTMCIPRVTYSTHTHALQHDNGRNLHEAYDLNQV